MLNIPVLNKLLNSSKAFTLHNSILTAYLEKMLIFIWKEHWQSHQIHHLTCRIQVSFPLQIIIFANNRFLWQKNASHLKKCLLTSGTKRAAADKERRHQMKLFFLSGAELGFAGQFHGEYVHFEADLLSPITQHLSKTNPRMYCTKAEGNRIYFQMKINLSITHCNTNWD